MHHIIQILTWSHSHHCLKGLAEGMDTGKARLLRCLCNIHLPQRKNLLGFFYLYVNNIFMKRDAKIIAEHIGQVIGRYPDSLTDGIVVQVLIFIMGINISYGIFNVNLGFCLLEISFPIRLFLFSYSMAQGQNQENDGICL